MVTQAHVVEELSASRNRADDDRSSFLLLTLHRIGTLNPSDAKENLVFPQRSFTGMIETFHF